MGYINISRQCNQYATQRDKRVVVGIWSETCNPNKTATRFHPCEQSLVKYTFYLSIECNNEKILSAA